MHVSTYTSHVKTPSDPWRHDTAFRGGQSSAGVNSVCRKVTVVFSLPGCLQPEDCAPTEITPTEMNLIPLYSINPAPLFVCVITLSPCSTLCNNSASLFDLYYKLYIIKASRVLGFLQTRALTTWSQLSVFSSHSHHPSQLSLELCWMQQVVPNQGHGQWLRETLFKRSVFVPVKRKEMKRKIK